MDRNELSSLLAFAKDTTNTDHKRYGYTRDLGFKTKDTNVLVKNNIPFVLHRASKTKRDYRLDFELGILQKDIHTSKRYRRAVNITKAAQHKYKTGAVAIGHSLGGLMAEYSNAKNKIFTYNKFATIQSQQHPLNPIQTDIRRINDIPSALSQFNKNVVTLPSAFKKQKPNLPKIKISPLHDEFENIKYIFDNLKHAHIVPINDRSNPIDITPYFT